jgi:hypothetical protein
MRDATGHNITDQESFRMKKTANLFVETQKFVSITHGSHENNYVWHIRPNHKKKPWAVSTDRVLFAIGKILNEYLSNDILIDLHLPNQSWQIEEITVRANEALDHWTVNEESLKKITGQFFEVLNTLI